MTRTDWFVILGIAVASVLCAAPGVHLFELWMAPRPALLISHGLAVVGLAVAVWQWRIRRRRASIPNRPG